MDRVMAHRALPLNAELLASDGLWENGALVLSYVPNSGPV